MKVFVINIFNKINNYYKRKGLYQTLKKIFSYALIKIGFKLPPPYQYIQTDVENNLAKYLGVDNSDIKNIIIVGAHHGDEVKKMLKIYKSCKFHLFEPYKEYYEILNSKFQHSKNIFIHNKAISNKKSITKFYDTNIEGSQSILEPGKFAKEKYNISSHAEIDVETEKLDNIFSDEIIDCLWIDVQGAEGLVIEGAINLLERTKAIFVEVSIREGLYNKGIIMSDIVSIARKVDFELVGLGIDYDNFTGNAFLVKKII